MNATGGRGHALDLNEGECLLLVVDAAGELQENAQPTCGGLKFIVDRVQVPIARCLGDLGIRVDSTKVHDAAQRGRCGQQPAAADCGE